MKRYSEKEIKILTEHYSIQKVYKSSNFVGTVGDVNCSYCKATYPQTLAYLNSQMKKGKGKQELFCSKECSAASVRQVTKKRAEQVFNILPPFICKDIKNKAILSQNALTRGISAEYMVCAHLINQGYNAFLTNQNCAYDLVADFNGKLLRVQVKSCLKPRKTYGNNSEYLSYNFCIKKGSGINARTYNKSDFDLLALVGLDLGVIAYIPFYNTSKNIIQLSPVNWIRRNNVIKKNIDTFPFEKAAIDCLNKIKENYDFSIQTQQKKKSIFKPGKTKTCNDNGTR